MLQREFFKQFVTILRKENAIVQALLIRRCSLAAFVFVFGCEPSSPEPAKAQKIEQEAENKLIQEATPPAYRPEDSLDKLMANGKDAAEKRALKEVESALKTLEGIWLAKITEDSSQKEMQEEIELLTSSRRDENDGRSDRRRKEDGSLESEDEVERRRNQQKSYNDRNERRKQEARTSKVEVTLGRIEIGVFKEEGFSSGQLKASRDDGRFIGVQAEMTHPDGRVRKVFFLAPFSKQILDGTIEEVRGDGDNPNWMILGNRSKDE